MTQSGEPYGTYREVRKQLAQQGLPPAFAKLYSQHTLLSNGQPGLQGWRANEANLRLHDATRLLSIALAERESNVDGWQQAARRAGELLEWLSHDETNQDNLPFSVLSSAAYQLAGYPARSFGLLNRLRDNDQTSQILQNFLKSDFRALLQNLTEYWQEHPASALQDPFPWDDEENLPIEFRSWVIGETVSALGVLCSFMRWGDESRLDAAIRKLSAIAALMLHDRDPYSWLVAKLCSEVAIVYQRTSLRSALAGIIDSLSVDGQQAFENYLRFSFFTTKALAWPSQLSGIDHLVTDGSFALCTPTGSGKTAIAEIAVLNNLFRQRSIVTDPDLLDILPLEARPMALYLVPSRALATEVEAKLSRVLSTVTSERIIVTGLYGGNDWGPTDAWLTADEKVVLICTYEKAEALLRFLSPLFLSRVSVIIVDEAHNIQFNGSTVELARNESRSLRLESLIARILTYVQNSELQCIALSAVAAGFSTMLAKWISRSPDSAPVQTSYQSTRQLVGSLECSADGRTEIKYDLLDGWGLRFDDTGRSAKPFVPNPFPLCPIMERWTREGPEKRVRPFLFWAAMHLATPDTTGKQRSVLISIMQEPGGYAEDFLQLLSRDWRETELPVFFLPPTEYHKQKLWQQCLASCEDYFGKDSREYELLEKGIVLHHGKMPGLMARLLVQLIEDQVVNIVLATSTLSEGVNLPFETVLIPSLRRGRDDLNTSEFRNLSGRAGRPGYGTEGRSLVLLPPHFASDSSTQTNQVNKVRSRYTRIIGQTMQKGEDSTLSDADALSPLAELLSRIQNVWQRVAHTDSEIVFFDWLERTVPTKQEDSDQTDGVNVLGMLDTLDGILISAIVELEQLSETEIALTTLEERLQEIWRRTYARYASQEEAQLRKIFLHRGRSLKISIYPDRSQRRRLYRTGLRPVAGLQLIDIYTRLRPHLETGHDYADWTDNAKFQYIKEIVRQIADIPEFALPERSGRGAVNWEDVLLWWLSSQTAVARPSRTQVSIWHNYVSQWFQYRFNWGLGSIIALATDDAYQGALRLPALTDWPLTGLPWIVFWLKELIVWGTLDPVAAYLLSHKLEITRSNAEQVAQDYYRTHQSADANERLKATEIKAWADNLARSRYAATNDRLARRIEVELLRDFANAPTRRWRVVPVENGQKLHWLDPAGFPLATSSHPENWESSELHTEDFLLDPIQRVVVSQSYLFSRQRR